MEQDDQQAVPADASAATVEADTQAEGISIRADFLKEETQQRLQEGFASGQPYPYIVLDEFLGEAGRAAVRRDLEKVRAEEKETDLFHFFQTKDLIAACSSIGGSRNASSQQLRRRRGRATSKSGNSAKRRRLQAPAGSGGCNAAMDDVPALKELIAIFKSETFRNLCQAITQCGPLSEHVDLSSQIYPTGGHLLCHDDVIGTRKISFIYYLSDTSPPWHAEEGGALELYPQNQSSGSIGMPANAPTNEVLPVGDSLAMFVVEPGVSFHSVREVIGSRARVSIQGWLHAPSLEQTASYGVRDKATLQQLLGHRKKGEADSTATVTRGATAEQNGAAPPLPQEGTGPQAHGDTFSTQDAECLSRFVAKEYLDPAQLKAVAEQFGKESQVVLSSFLREDVMEPIRRALQAADAVDGTAQANGKAETKSDGPPNYDAGVNDHWQVVGPPHLRRHLSLQSPLEGRKDQQVDAATGHSPHSELAARLRSIAQDLISTDAFRKWLRTATEVNQCDIGHVEVRRFRPGMDYTVAICPKGDLATNASLDVVLTFLSDTSEAAMKKWQSEEVGGFESYIAADDEEEETAKVQEVYRKDDEGPLLNLPAAANTLCVVLRDSQTLRFTKYLTRHAPSSRTDVSVWFSAELPPESDAEEAAAPSEEVP